ncbi:hypothetical protein EDD15DRAFT_2195645 [Pisolithus albus]|nr:hypothetical protein EDD15DRAFT_2195645 [Pisolithus albus]
MVPGEVPIPASRSALAVEHATAKRCGAGKIGYLDTKPHQSCGYSPYYGRNTPQSVCTKTHEIVTLARPARPLALNNTEVGCTSRYQNVTPFNERCTSDKVFLGLANKPFPESNNYGLGRVTWILLGGVNRITVFSLIMGI